MTGTHWGQIFDSRFHLSRQDFVCGFHFHLYSSSISTLFLFRFYVYFITQFALKLHGISAYEAKLGPNILFHFLAFIFSSASIT